MIVLRIHCTGAAFYKRYIEGEIGGRIEVMGGRGKRRKQLLDDDEN
jgi:hypothetical protein